MCAPYEGGPLERLLWGVIGKTRSGRHRYTDDTQMAIDLARHLLRNNSIKEQDLAVEFASSYKWSRGYGPSTVAVLKKVRRGANWHSAATSKFKDGSFGNGAAMRIPGLALYYANRLEDIDAAIERASSVTHPNQSAIQGAKLLSHAILGMLNETPPLAVIERLETNNSTEAYNDKLQNIKELLSGNSLLDPKAIRSRLGTGTAAVESCSAAVFIGLHFHDKKLDDMLDFVNKCRGDTDTIGAMAGSIWGASNGFASIPDNLVKSVEGADVMKELAARIYEIACKENTEVYT